MASNMIRIYADFNRIERKRFIQLGTVETNKHLQTLRSQLREGLKVLLEDESYEAEGVLELDADGTWWARILPESGGDK